jgi:HEPN domain-containing protein
VNSRDAVASDTPGTALWVRGDVSHIQQAIEKWLKAMIAWKGHKYPFTHDIGALLDAVEKAGLTKPKHVDADLAETLTDYAEKQRYESVRQGPPLDRDALIALLEAVAAWADSVGVRSTGTPT